MVDCLRIHKVSRGISVYNSISDTFWEYRSGADCNPFKIIEDKYLVLEEDWGWRSSKENNLVVLDILQGHEICRYKVNSTYYFPTYKDLLLLCDNLTKNVEISNFIKNKYNMKLDMK